MIKRFSPALALLPSALVLTAPPVAVAVAVAKPIKAPTPGPTLPLGHAGRWITDASGRVVIVHGINMVYKKPPYYPAATGFGADDAAFLRSIGFNAVRVGVIWEAVEPMPGVFDDSYLNEIASTVSTLAHDGIVSLLDFHQDLFNEEFQGEGAPAWAVQDGGLPNPMLGFPGNYLTNLALQHAFDQFWANAPGPGGVGLEDRFAAAWAHVATRFRAEESVLGYEVFNEPWPGTAWQPCALPTGCPAFDAKLEAFYRKVAEAIRAVDPRTLVWYEPNVLFNFGSPTNLPALGDPHAGFAFHDYCLTASATGCSTEAEPFTNAVAHVAKTHEALLETEFGATQAVGYLDSMVADADHSMVPWLEWAYCGCQDPTTSGPGNEQAIVVDPSKPPTGSNVIGSTLHQLVEPYPQVVSGTPQSWSFTRSDSTFELHFTTARASGGGGFKPGSVSEIATPSLVYGGHYAARVTGAAILSTRGAPVLEIASCKGAGSITVTVTPSGKGGGSCKPPQAPGRHRHRRHRPGK